MGHYFLRQPMLLKRPLVLKWQQKEISCTLQQVMIFLADDQKHEGGTKLILRILLLSRTHAQSTMKVYRKEKEVLSRGFVWIVTPEIGKWVVGDLATNMVELDHSLFAFDKHLLEFEALRSPRES